MRHRGDDGRTLATVLFTDIVGSTELASELGDVHWKQVLATHHGVVRKTLKRYNGHEVDTAGDGFFATFARPADAIRCASDIIDQLRAIGIHIRAGVHMGEVEQMGSKVGGIAVHIGARVAAKAGADEILVSSTVRDLVAGSDIRFGQGDLYDLKGVPGEWRLMSVERELSPDVPAKPLIEAPQAKAARRKTVPAATVGIAAALIVVLAVVLVLTLGGGASNVVAVPGANTVSLIDTKSNRFAGTSDVGNGPADATSGAGSIWVLNTSDQTFSQVDSKTGKVLSGARSVGGAPTGIAFGAGSVWIATGFGNTAGQSGSILRFDTAPGPTKKVIEVGSGISSISFGDGALWVANSLTNTVSKIDPDAQAVVSTTKVGNSPQAVVAGNGSLWVANTLDNSVWKIDEASGRVTSKVTVLTPPTGLALQGTNTLWIVSATGNTVSRVDTSSGTTVATIPVGAQPLAIVAGPGGVWVVADAGHDVERINAATSTVSARLKVDGSPDGIAMDGERVWVTVQK